MTDPKLIELTEEGNFRNCVERCIKAIEAKGVDAKIFEALRTVAEQREKVKKGYSKTMKSEHLPDKTGKARAADVADAKKGWSADKRFWLLLGSAAWAYGVGWGGLFGLSPRRVKAVQEAIKTLREAGWPKQHEAYQVPLGWDVAHLQSSNNWPAVHTS